jgi:hypothetical protein
MSRGTPQPFEYMRPRLTCANPSPLLAARSNR